MEAEWYFNMGQFDNAEISLYKSIGKAQTAGEINILLCTMFLQMRLAFLRGNFAEITAILEKMRRQIAQTGEYHTLQMVELCEISVYSHLDQIVKISEILVPQEGSVIRLRFVTLPMFNIVYGRVLLSGGEYLKLIGSADQFLAVASVIPNLLGIVYTYIYLAAANCRIFREKEAAESLKKALDIAMPGKLYMPFVENCDYIGPLLEKLPLPYGGNQDIKNIMALYQTYKGTKEKMIRVYTEKERPQFTHREMDVARLAAEGATNKEIGKQLYISVNTVKAELKSVFSKLSINNRALLKQHIENLK